MSYFPFYIDIKDKKILLVGAGSVAAHKLGKLVTYNCKITIVAKEYSDMVNKLAGLYPDRIRCIHRGFEAEDVKNMFCVIAATPDEEVNAYIYRLCHDNNILVNVVDDKEKCDFIFSSTIQKGSLNIGISSGGASPVITTLIKKDIEKIIPDNIEEILIFLENLRRQAKEVIKDNEKRSLFFKEAAGICYTQNRCLTNEETDKLLLKYKSSL